MDTPLWTDRTWAWVCLTYATFRLELLGGKVIQSSPIARWAQGKTLGQVKSYYKRKGVFIELREYPD